MNANGMGVDRDVRMVNCPVCGKNVLVSVSYRSEDGKPALVGFECDLEGQCGIPSWDPCPLYVTSREKPPA